MKMEKRIEKMEKRHPEPAPGNSSRAGLRPALTDRSRAEILAEQRYGNRREIPHCVRDDNGFPARFRL